MPLEETQNLVDADKLNDTLAKLETLVEEVGADPLFHHLLMKEQYMTGDGKHTKRRIALNVTDSDWANLGPVTLLPAAWLYVLRENGRMMSLAFELAGMADNNGQILQVNIENFAKKLDHSTAKVYAYLMNLVGLGIVTILDPTTENADGNKKLYHNLQLHSLPVGWKPAEQQDVEATESAEKNEAA